jgi:hypothetical protein
MRSVMIIGAVVALVGLCGCDLVDPARPTQVKDTEIFGNLLEVTRSDEQPTTWTATVQGGAPRVLRAAEEEQGKPTPSVEKGLVATVTVTADTVVIAEDGPARLEDIDSGTEVVVLPVPGTSRMLGSDEIRIEAQMLMDFDSYQRWRLPKLGGGGPDAADDPSRINSAGGETAPFPVGDGTVLYFASYLRPPATETEGWHGAWRDGFVDPEVTGFAVERSYRTELGEEGWTAPEPVVFEGLDEAEVVRVTWVSDDETSCLVTVAGSAAGATVMAVERPNGSAPWGTPQVVEALGPDAKDAVYLAGSRTKMLFVSSRDGRDRSDLFLFDPEVGAMPLEPQINTFGSEWCPRTGPAGELYFCREDRQLLLQGGQVRQVRLQWPHRIFFSQAAPSADGKWLFFCMPRYRPLALDDDIYVAALREDGSLGVPVPVDDWRP